MTTERMLELLLISKLFEANSTDDFEYSGYDGKALANRAEELAKEFLEPYVIDNAEKSE